MRWKIYYDNETTFSSDDGPWEEAPSDGVLFVVDYSGGKKNPLSGNDFYFLHDGVIAATGDLGPLLRKLEFIKFGRWTSHAKMEKAAARVRADS